MTFSVDSSINQLDLESRLRNIISLSILIWTSGFILSFIYFMVLDINPNLPGEPWGVNVI